MSPIGSLSTSQISDHESGVEFLSLDDAGPMLDALASETARAILLTVNSEPSTPAVIADRIGTSVQNVGYHLSRLRDVGLVTTVGTQYSEKGREMNVYAPAVDSLVISDASPDDDRESGF